MDIRWSWIASHTDDIWENTVQHLQLVGTSLALSIAIAIPVAVLVHRSRALFGTATAVSGALYTIPSLAMFAFLLTIFDIGFWPAVVALVLYSLLILIRNAVVGLRSVPGAVRDAALGMGLTRRQTLLKVELPLALPSIMAGIRITAVSTVGIATIAVFIGAGGLGELIYNDGIQRGLFLTPILVGAVVATLMAVLIDLALVVVERLMTPWQRAGR
jgi:osmoprotectant transport system permease protein